MGNHRADHRAAPRRRSALSAETPDTGYVGRRVAGRESAPVTSSAVAVPTPGASIPGRRRAAVPADVLVGRTPTVELPALVDIPAFDPLTDSSATTLRAIQPGRRRAVRHAGRRGPLFRGLPSLPVAVGVATLAIAIGGVVTSADTQLTSATERLTAANATSGSFGTVAVGERAQSLSRDSDRDALAAASGTDLVEQAERHAEERNSALGELARDAEKEAAEIALNRWVLPIASGSYRLSARFNQPGGYWSSGYHTGLDFAAPEGTPIRAIANGTITFVGDDGAYGNKTVLTLEDGTELWFAHQSAYAVSEGDVVRSGEIIGYVGNTGNSYGAHVHLEVHPGGGDGVDPYAALVANGVTP